MSEIDIEATSVATAVASGVAAATAAVARKNTISVATRLSSISGVVISLEISLMYCETVGESNNEHNEWKQKKMSLYANNIP